MDSKHYPRRRKGRFVFFAMLAVAFFAMIGYVVMLLWNLLLPEIIDVGPVTFWQAIGIFLLCRILFGFGPARGCGGNGRRGWRRAKLGTMGLGERARFAGGCGADKFARYGDPQRTEGASSTTGMQEDVPNGETRP
ncbi:MAG: hypothetical protein V7724_05570 [Sediminicola sp.]|tara:strand:+ start:93964 stop:94371 length:408 start_codon:yes stop_codon:yes gene_type:complete